MSAIDPRLNTSLDALQRQALGTGLDPVLAELAGAEETERAQPSVDDGALVLAAPWEGPATFSVADQQAALAQAELGDAVDQGVDGVLDGLG